jgi:hypothetical protein
LSRDGRRAPSALDETLHMLLVILVGVLIGEALYVLMIVALAIWG